MDVAPIKVNFLVNQQAQKQENSQGSKCDRIQLLDVEDSKSSRYAIALAGPFKKDRPILNFIEKRFNAIVNIEDKDRFLGYATVNKNSLRKRLGIGKEELNEALKANQNDATTLISKKIQELIKSKELNFNYAYDYQGEFQEGQPHGHGTLTFTNGAVYTGQLIAGEPHGHGSLTYLDGDKYIGKFIHNQFEGQGTYFYKDGNVYEGIFKKGQPSGQGTVTFRR